MAKGKKKTPVSLEPTEACKLTSYFQQKHFKASSSQAASSSPLRTLNRGRSSLLPPSSQDAESKGPVALRKAPVKPAFSRVPTESRDATVTTTRRIASSPTALSTKAGPANNAKPRPPIRVLNKSRPERYLSSSSPVQVVPITASTSRPPAASSSKKPGTAQSPISISSRSDAASRISISSGPIVRTTSSTCSSPLQPIAIVHALGRPERARHQNMGDTQLTSPSSRRRLVFKVVDMPRTLASARPSRKRKSAKAEEIDWVSCDASLMSSNKAKKRKSIFEDEPEDESVIMASPKTLQKRSSPKKARITSDDEVVPSSQSDEEQLGEDRVRSRRKNTTDIDQSIEAWRISSQTNAASGNIVFGDGPDMDAGHPMDLDSPPLTPTRSSSLTSVSAELFHFPPAASETQMNADLGLSTVPDPRTPDSRSPYTQRLPTLPNISFRVASSSSSLTQAPSTPPSKSATYGTPPPPVTPRAMDEQSKTAAIIEKIKAQAYAVSSPEPDDKGYGELKALSDTSSDSEDEKIFSVLGLKPTTKTRPDLDRRVSYSPSTGPSPPSSSSSTAASAPRRSRRNITATGPTMVPSVTPLKPMKRKARDPFAALLREKKKSEQIGTATLSVPAYQADSRLHSPCSVAQEPIHGAEELEEELREADRVRLLGSKEGLAIGKIINRDMKGVGIIRDSRDGIDLWDAELDADPMDLDAAKESTLLPQLELHSSSGILKLLQDAAERQDTMQIAILLQSGLLADTTVPWTTTLLCWLFEIAASTRQPQLQHHACHALCQRATHGLMDPNVQLPFISLVTAIIGLGAKVDFIDSLRWDYGSQQLHEVDNTERWHALYRIVNIIDCMARADLLEAGEVPKFICALLLIGQEASAPIDTRRDVMCTLETVCQLPSGDINVDKICEEVHRLSASFSAADKARLLSLLPGGSPSSRRVSQWVAFVMIGGIRPSGFPTSSTLPPLSSVIEIISRPSSTGGGLFEIRKLSDQSDTTDYDALASHIEVLSGLLTNIPLYVGFEKQEQTSESLDTSADVTFSPSPSRRTQREQAKSRLEVVHGMLQTLGGKIVDTRGAHLDRSRAKAAIQRLTMRMHYQRLAALSARNASGRPQAKKLDAWFSPRRLVDKGNNDFS